MTEPPWRLVFCTTHTVPSIHLVVESSLVVSWFLANMVRRRIGVSEFSSTIQQVVVERRKQQLLG
jgi:hypothetical protein